MPRSLARRIVLAIVVLAAATWLAIGATLFVVLRTLHSDATTARLSDTVAPLANQVRQTIADGDARTILGALQEQVAGTDYNLYVLTADGRMVALQQNEPDLTGLRVDPLASRGDLDRGTYRGRGGQAYAWAASILRNPGQAGPRAIVLAVQDRAAADALRDVLSSLPVVILVSILVGAPIAWLLTRSVVDPIRRLAVASADLPTASMPAPLPVEGPTEVRDLTERFNAMAAELSATRKQEAELLANLRHDLRTPLTVIGGFAAALADGTATGPDATKAATAIGEEAQRLEHLVGELGAIERLRTGPAGLRPEPLDAAGLLRATAERFGPSAEAHGLAIEVLRADAGPTIVADRVAIERILANLVSNSMSAFEPRPRLVETESSGSTAAGGVDNPPAGPVPARPVGHIWLDAREVTGGLVPSRPLDPARAKSMPSPGSTPAIAHAVVISVTDDGPGFPPGQTERAFERFYRGDASRAGAGSGLGLSIVRELAAVHGGRAIAENVAPRGARVSVILPLVPPPPDAA